MIVVNMKVGSLPTFQFWYDGKCVHKYTGSAPDKVELNVRTLSSLTISPKGMPSKTKPLQVIIFLCKVILFLAPTILLFYMFYSMYTAHILSWGSGIILVTLFVSTLVQAMFCFSLR